MANEEQLEILKSGVEEWNRWREVTQEVEFDLREAELSWVDLSGISFYLTDLRGANLRGADLIGADLRHANLNGADLIASNLTKANLRGANLSWAQLRETILDEANFTRVEMVGTTIANCDLTKIKGLDSVGFIGPLSIGFDTLYHAKDRIPHKFLRDAGVPENFITYMSSLTGKAFEYFSCFISYTEADDAFSKRLYADLQAAGLRVWRWREDAKWGAPIEKNIDQAVRIYDKLIVICSKDSLKAPAVIDEIDRAFQKEHALMKDSKVPEVLFPITIDDHIFDKWEHYLKPKVMAKTVGDFRGWEDPQKYDAALQRLIDALKQE